MSEAVLIDLSKAKILPRSARPEYFDADALDVTRRYALQPANEGLSVAAKAYQISVKAGCVEAQKIALDALECLITDGPDGAPDVKIYATTIFGKHGVRLDRITRESKTYDNTPGVRSHGYFNRDLKGLTLKEHAKVALAGRGYLLVNDTIPFADMDRIRILNLPVETLGAVTDYQTRIAMANVHSTLALEALSRQKKQKYELATV